ncbi:MAG: 1-acyl-sn-glycerol-3-phosphate acyltransferase, partial [Candidatus Uhrbacteria bacterium]|nr:1-acyl-sn-glycerol-3-phosphate acyltransferase [Candidatus Uhrbacteria bacterium]
LGRCYLFPRSWLRQAPRHANRVISLFTHEGLMRMNAVRNVRNVKPFSKQENIVVIANHPSLAGVPMFTWLLGEMLNRELVFVGKIEHKNNPFVGWPLRLLDAGIFIDRDNRSDALELLRTEVPRVFMRGAAIVILADQSRLTAKRLKEDHRKYLGRVDQLDAFVHTLVPRIGGTRQILLAAGKHVRVIDVTSGIDRPDLGIWDALLHFGANFHFHAEDVPNGLETDENFLRMRLVRRWVAKNRFLSRIKSAA